MCLHPCVCVCLCVCVSVCAVPHVRVCTLCLMCRVSFTLSVCVMCRFRTLRKYKAEKALPPRQLMKLIHQIYADKSISDAVDDKAHKTRQVGLLCLHAPSHVML